MITKEEVCSNEANENYLKLIKQAAKRKSPELLIELLFSSGEVKRLARKLRVHWAGISPDEVDLALSEALYVLFASVKEQKEIMNPQAFVWRISDRKISDCYRRMKREVSLPDDKLIFLANRLNEETGKSLWHNSGAVEQRLEQAIVIARENAKKIGNKKIQKVLLFILKDLEKGNRNVSNQAIAEAVGLRAETVRVYKFRAFKQLEKHIRKLDKSYDKTIQ